MMIMAVNNYVHYGDAYDNAFWNGTPMVMEVTKEVQILMENLLL
jgi:hypothetical protein